MNTQLLANANYQLDQLAANHLLQLSRQPRQRFEYRRYLDQLTQNLPLQRIRRIRTMLAELRKHSPGVQN